MTRHRDERPLFRYRVGIFDTFRSSVVRADRPACRGRPNQRFAPRCLSAGRSGLSNRGRGQPGIRRVPLGSVSFNSRAGFCGLPDTGKMFSRPGSSWKSAVSGACCRTIPASHGWNAHDDRAAGLAYFFNAAELLRFALTGRVPSGTSRWRRASGRSHDRFAPGRGAFSRFPRSSSAIERRLLLTHESFHGIFFASAEYRAFCFRLWDSLDPRARPFSRGSSTSWAMMAIPVPCRERVPGLPHAAARALCPGVFRAGGAEVRAGELSPEGTILKLLVAWSYLGSRFGIRAGGTLEARWASGESG